MKIIRSIRDRKLIIERKNRYISISGYGKIVVCDTVEAGASIRLLLVNGTRESATFTTPGLRNEPVFEYLRTIAEILRKREASRHALILGGAGYAFPKMFISRYPDATLDVIENNPEMPQIARKYFYLDELYETYDLDRTGRLTTTIDDGLHFLQNCKRRFDLIINDAFVGNIADEGLGSAAGCQAVFDCLEEGGLYLVNAITARTGPRAMPGILALETMSRIFGHARMIPVRPDFPPEQNQNVILHAQKGEK